MTKELAQRQGISEDLHLALQQMFPRSEDESQDNVKSITEKYHKYKREYVKQQTFNPDEEDFSECLLKVEQLVDICLFAATTLPLVQALLEAVFIYFDTATYDEIEKDQKVAIKAILSFIKKTHQDYDH